MATDDQWDTSYTDASLTYPAGNGNKLFQATGPRASDLIPRGLGTRNTGRLMWQAQIGNGGANSALGMCDAGVSTSYFELRGNGNLYWNNSVNNISVTSIPFVSPAIAIYAVDFGLSLFWACAATAFGQGWNGSGTANPDTNTGGLPIPAGITGRIFAFAPLAYETDWLMMPSAADWQAGTTPSMPTTFIPWGLALPTSSYRVPQFM